MLRDEEKGEGQQETLCDEVFTWDVIPKASHLENLVVTEGQGHTGSLLILGYLQNLAYLLDQNSELGE